jgi:OPA family glycerol-3-phosphate transporter-like MFS transporter
VPIILLLIAIAVVVWRLPKVELGHSDAYKMRRLMNWVPLGFTYAFLYFGRYNLAAINSTLDKMDLLSKAEFNSIDGIGQIVYGVSFLINGPLTDKLGGRFTIILAAGGAAIANIGMAILMGLALDKSVDREQLVTGLTALMAINMYFQSFGAVSIVKVNAPWFHVRERGMLGGLFGILISLGLYFAYDWSKWIQKNLGTVEVFAIPAAVLAAFVVVAIVLIKDSPSKAGFADFDTGDASSGQTEHVPVFTVVKRMLSQRVILLLIAIEFCSGFMRQAVMKQYRYYADAMGEADGFINSNWGLLTCVAGILGGVFAGLISDYVFGSRRGPVSAVLYGGLFGGALVATFSVGGPVIGWTVVAMSLCVIGVHGMLSGTATMDFGGAKNAGVVTGVIDGFVYLGGASQAFFYGAFLPSKDALKTMSREEIVDAWQVWPGAMIPVALVGLLLCTRVWNARARPGTSH